MDQPDLREVVLDCREIPLRTRTMAIRWRCLAVIYPPASSMLAPWPKDALLGLKSNTKPRRQTTRNICFILTCVILPKGVSDRRKQGRHELTSKKLNGFGGVKLRGVGRLVPPDGKNPPSPTRPLGVVIAQTCLSNNRTRNSTLKTNITTHY